MAWASLLVWEYQVMHLRMNTTISSLHSGGARLGPWTSDLPGKIFLCILGIRIRSVKLISKFKEESRKHTTRLELKSSSVLLGQLNSPQLFIKILWLAELPLVTSFWRTTLMELTLIGKTTMLWKLEKESSGWSTSQLLWGKLFLITSSPIVLKPPISRASTILMVDT